MLLRLVLTLAFTLCVVQAYTIDHTPAETAGIDTRIVGGEEISIIRHSYQISLRRRTCSQCAYAHTCGGSLLDERTVLTAAHCVNNRDVNDFIVVAGTDYRSGTDGVVSRVEKIVQHELFNASITDNDIALLYLSPGIVLDELKTSAVDLTNSQPLIGATATVAGWGRTTENGLQSPKLLFTRVHIVNSTVCQEAYNWRPISSGMLCAGATGGGRDACQGDSGGALLIDGLQVGIVSWGEGCARADYPGVYVNVAHFIDWIEEQRAQNQPNV